jgi:ankyrin repeat protein
MSSLVKKENIGKKITPEHLVYRKFKLAIQSGDKERLMDVLNDSLQSERRKSKGLILIARYNKLELMSLVIRRGCSVNAVHHSGFTPLQVAAQCGSLAVLNALLHEGTLDCNFEI